MTITITIVAENVQAVHSELITLLAGAGTAGKGGALPVAGSQISEAAQERASPGSVSNFTAAEDPAPESVVKEPSRRGRKAKEQTSVAPEPVASVQPAKEDEAPTLDNARKWIKAVVAADGANGAEGGMEAGQALVISFGVAKLGELPESKYGEFIAACRQKLSKGSASNEGLFA